MPRIACPLLFACLAACAVGCGAGSSGSDPYGCFEHWPACLFDAQCPGVTGKPPTKVTCNNFKCQPDPAPTCTGGCMTNADCGNGRVCLDPAIAGICVDAPPDLVMMGDYALTDLSSPRDLPHHD